MLCLRWILRHIGDMQSDDLITVDADILGGTPVFKGTRVPVKTIFEYLEDNYTLAEFLDCFPSVSREMACRVLALSESALIEARISATSRISLAGASRSSNFRPTSFAASLRRAPSFRTRFSISALANSVT